MRDGCYWFGRFKHNRYAQYPLKVCRKTSRKTIAKPFLQGYRSKIAGTEALHEEHEVCAGRLIALPCFAPCWSAQLLLRHIRQLPRCVNLRAREQKTQRIRPSRGSMRSQNSRQNKEKFIRQKRFFLLFAHPLCGQKAPASGDELPSLPIIYLSATWV